MKDQRTIYDLELHETIYIEAEDCYVIRVASGWLYKYYQEITNDNGMYYEILNKVVFVPYDNKFQKVPK